MVAVRLLLAAALPALASATEVTPVEKVTTLLNDLKSQVEEEGTKEAVTYDKFACFCKDTTKEKSKSITKGQDEIDTLNADINADTATLDEKSTELGERKEKQEELSAKLDKVTARCRKESAEFEAKILDLSQAISSLEKALKALKESKASSFIALKESVKESLALADALSLIKAPKRKAVQAFLQQTKVDPSDAEYKSHTGGVTKTLEGLEVDFKDEKTKTQDEWDKHTTACDEEKKAIDDEMTSNKEAMESLQKDIDQLETDIADNKESLVNAENQLADDSVYLKDLTVRCEGRAHDWDQRTTMRGQELAALSKAIEIIEGKVTEKEEVNKRALLLHKNATVAQKNTTVTAKVEVKAAPAKAKAVAPAHKEVVEAAKKVAANSSLRGVGKAVLLEVSEHRMVKRNEQAQQLLSSLADKYQSPVLMAIASKVSSNPFGKIKKLIQDLVERLVAEATAEATKKGFCDTELGKAKHSRDARYADTEQMSAAMAELKARKDTLETAITDFEVELEELNDALTKATELRAEEKETNIATIKDGKEGLEAVTEAIEILKEFYATAAKASLLQKASPVEEDDPGAPTGSYKGNQDASTGIIGLLEVIQGDFDRTVRVTTADEKSALEKFVDFDRTSKVSIAAKERGKELSEQELEQTKNALEQTTSDLTAAQEMLDSALKAIEDLKPMCIDNGMSYAERVAAREKEIEALKKALCLVDPDKVESECQ
jgi:hypothetical protein